MSPEAAVQTDAEIAEERLRLIINSVDELNVAIQSGQLTGDSLANAMRLLDQFDEQIREAVRNYKGDLTRHNTLMTIAREVRMTAARRRERILDRQDEEEEESMRRYREDMERAQLLHDAKETLDSLPVDQTATNARLAKALESAALDAIVRAELNIQNTDDALLTRQFLENRLDVLDMDIDDDTPLTLEEWHRVERFVVEHSRKDYPVAVWTKRQKDMLRDVHRMYWNAVIKGMHTLSNRSLRPVLALADSVNPPTPSTPSASSDAQSPTVPRGSPQSSWLGSVTSSVLEFLTPSPKKAQPAERNREGARAHVAAAVAEQAARSQPTRSSTRDRKPNPPHNVGHTPKKKTQ